MEVGNIVEIQDNNEWKGLYGIVDCIYENVAYIFCVQHPWYLYKATDKNNIRVVKN